MLLNLIKHRVVLILYLLILAFATLTPNNSGDGKWLWFEIKPTIEILINLFLLTPLAILLKIQFNFPRYKILAIGFLTTLFIENLQVFIPGRFRDVRDMALNTISLVVGLIIFRLAKLKSLTAKTN